MLQAALTQQKYLRLLYLLAQQDRQALLDLRVLKALRVMMVQTVMTAALVRPEQPQVLEHRQSLVVL